MSNYINDQKEEEKDKLEDLPEKVQFSLARHGVLTTTSESSNDLSRQ